MNIKNIIIPITLSGSLLLGGCSSIIGNNTQLVSISSTPDNANIIIKDEKGDEIFKGKTPTTVTLEKSDGSYWGGKSFTVNIIKNGYQSQSIPIKSHPNGWYIGGNFIFGGLIGWFIVDPFNGGMYTLTPEQINAELGEDLAHNNSATDGSIKIMLLEDVPPTLQKLMTKLE